MPSHASGIRRKIELNPNVRRLVMLCEVTTIILNLYDICIQLLTAVHTWQRIFPRTFRTAVKI